MMIGLVSVGKACGKYEKRCLTPNSSGRYSSFSSDGEQIVFERDDGIFVLDLTKPIGEEKIIEALEMQ